MEKNLKKNIYNWISVPLKPTQYCKSTILQLKNKTKQVYVPKAAIVEGQSTLKQEKLSLFLPSNAPLREHPQFGILAITGPTATQILLFWLDCRALQSAADFADCSMFDSGRMCPVIMPATDNSLFCWLKRNTRERKTNHGGVWPCCAA